VGARGPGRERRTRAVRRPTGSAPIATAIYQICNADGSNCHSGSQAVANQGAGQANAITGNFGITSPGSYTIKLWLEDVAGKLHIRLTDRLACPLPPK